MTLARVNTALRLLGTAGLVALSACSGEKSVSSSSGAPPPPSSAGAAETASSAPVASAAPLGSAAPSGSAAAADKGPPGLPKDMNVLVLSIDSVRADRLLSQGYKEDVMPNVNAFEKTAVAYSRFYATSSYTSQSLGGFLGGRYPSEIKRNGTFFGVYPPEETFFPELLQKGGVRTVSAQAHFYFNKDKAGFHQGFDVWDLVPDLKKSNTTDENITSPAHTEIILKELGDAANTKGRFFAWYHLMDPHDEYMSHPEGKDFGKKATQKYDGEIYFTDMHVGKILKYVESQPWGARTAIIITADHGEAFGEHKMYRHGFELWEILTHVPLMIRVPGVAPRKIDEPRSMVDLAPTILEMFSVPSDPIFHGTSLVSEVLGGEAKPRDVMVDLARTSDNDKRRALVRGNYKIYEYGDADGFELFDVMKDPNEEENLAKKDKAKFEEMKKAILDADKTVKEVCPKFTDKLKGKKKNKPC